MNATSSSAHVGGQQPSARDTFLADALHGLAQTPKQLSPKYLYDAEGSRLFDRICELPEYYVTRTELTIMAEHAPAMGRALGSGVLLVEPGSGSSTKIQYLLDHLQEPAGYVPVEISREHMLASVEELQAIYPELDILPVAADFTQPFQLPTSPRPVGRRVMYFPGSTLGNFPRGEAIGLLQRFHHLVGDSGAVLLGVDLRKDPAILRPAYDDAAGITAAFNRNLLVRMNRELGADFAIDQFWHRAVWNDDASRVEMHLVSQRWQKVQLQGQAFTFAEGEPLITEYSHKYSLNGLTALAETTGFRIADYWTDTQQWFGIFLLLPRE